MHTHAHTRHNFEEQRTKGTQQCSKEKLYIVYGIQTIIKFRIAVKCIFTWSKIGYVSPLNDLVKNWISTLYYMILVNVTLSHTSLDHRISCSISCIIFHVRNLNFRIWFNYMVQSQVLLLNFIFISSLNMWTNNSYS